MRSEATIRRWIKQLNAAEIDPRTEVYRQGAVMALSCALYDWPTPAQFLRLGVAKSGMGKETKKALREV